MSTRKRATPQSPWSLQSTGATLSTHGISLSNAVTTVFYVLVLLAFIVNLQEQTQQFYDEVKNAETSLLTNCYDKNPTTSITKAQTPACRQHMMVFSRPALSTILRRSMNCIVILKPLAWALFSAETTLDDFKGSSADFDSNGRTDFVWGLVTILTNVDLVKGVMGVALLSYVLSKLYGTVAWMYPGLAFLTSSVWNGQTASRDGEGVSCEDGEE